MVIRRRKSDQGSLTTRMYLKILAGGNFKIPGETWIWCVPEDDSRRESHPRKTGQTPGPIFRRSVPVLGNPIFFEMADPGNL